MRPLVLCALLLGCGPKPPAPTATTAGAAAAAVAPGLTGELVVEGPVQKRVSTAPADLVVFYGGEHKGSMETCGCPKRPRGSFARFAAYVNASRAANPAVPSVVVNAGYWLQDAMGFDGKLRADVTLQNEWMVKGARALGWDALNVAYPDVAGLTTLPADGEAPLPLVSANVTGPGVNRWVVVERGGQRIGITGVTAVGQTLTDVKGYTVAAPETAGVVLDALAKEADVVVLLSFQATEVARRLAAAHPVDVVIDAATYRDYADATLVGGAAWAFSNYQTMRLGELRLDLEGGRVLGGLSRHVDLDPELPDEPALAALTKQARAELDRAQQALYGVP